MFGFDDPLGGGGFGGLGGMDMDDGGMGGMGPRSGAGRGGRPPPRVPVTILCGFLGAGKTTLVQHILKNREGLKVGIVVNDVAEANVDSEVLKFEDADGIVGLQNGCACCSGRDDLFARLEELVESSGNSKLDKPWDRLVVECSGVAEPESIARELEAMGVREEPVMKRIFLAGITCVIDSSTFWDSYNSADSGAEDRQPLSNLLVNQLESADTVIFNKCDLVEDAELERLVKLISALSPNARQLKATRGAIPLRTLLPAEPVDLNMPAYVPTLENRHSVAVRSAAARAAKEGSHGHGHVEGHDHGHSRGHDHGHAHDHGEGHGGGHGHAHGHSHGHDVDCSECATTAAAQGGAAGADGRHAQYGLSSFVYQRKGQLFDAGLFSDTVRSLPVVAADFCFPGLEQPAEGDGREAAAGVFQGVLRSKGFVRVDGVDQLLYWSHAGRRVQVAPAPAASASASRVRQQQQEVVFIGVGMDQQRICSALDACLLPVPAEASEAVADGAATAVRRDGEGATRAEPSAKY